MSSTLGSVVKKKLKGQDEDIIKKTRFSVKELSPRTTEKERSDKVTYRMTIKVKMWVENNT